MFFLWSKRLLQATDNAGPRLQGHQDQRHCPAPHWLRKKSLAAVRQDFAATAQLFALIQTHPRLRVDVARQIQRKTNPDIYGCRNKDRAAINE